jgi:hypothetical protein
MLKLVTFQLQQYQSIPFNDPFQLKEFSLLLKLYANNKLSNKKYKEIKKDLPKTRYNQITKILCLYFVHEISNLIDSYIDESPFNHYHTFNIPGLIGKLVIDGTNVINCNNRYIKIFNFYTNILIYKIKLSSYQGICDDSGYVDFRFNNEYMLIKFGKSKCEYILVNIKTRIQKQLTFLNNISKYRDKIKINIYDNHIYFLFPPRFNGEEDIYYYSVSIDNLLQEKLIKENKTKITFDYFKGRYAKNHIFEIKNNKIYLIFFIDLLSSGYEFLYDLYVCIICIKKNIILEQFLLDSKILYGCPLNLTDENIKEKSFSIYNYAKWFFLSSDECLYLNATMCYYLNNSTSSHLNINIHHLKGKTILHNYRLKMIFL